MEFYISNSAPDLEHPNPQDWSLLEIYYGDREKYSYVINSHSLPDDQWFFISKVNSSDGEVVFEAHASSGEMMPFSINHFSESFNLTYLDVANRINQNSYIGFVPLEKFAQYITSADIYVNHENGTYLLNEEPIEYYSEIYSNYNLLDLDLLTDFITDNNLPPNEYEISFTISLNLDYGQEFPIYCHDYTMDSIILDIKEPTMTLKTGGSHSLMLENVYSDVDNHILTAKIEYNDEDFDYIKVDYKYNTPDADWINYGTFSSQQSPLPIDFNILNMRDGKISFRIIGYDHLGNSEIFSESDFWIVKDFDNHPNFAVEGLDDQSLYGLDNNDMIDIGVKVLPPDNDITKVVINTGYESFELSTIYMEDDHIYFSDFLDDNIKLNSTYYGVIGGEFTNIPITIQLYQNETIIASKESMITATDTIFNDIVNISNIAVNVTAQSNNIFMSITNGTESYKNLKNICDHLPYRLLKAQNSHTLYL
ncbi:hypothetical protein ES703_103691 [subsurface metagenome]